ncbi:MAG: LytTR family transcriptional regulator DNA-binding domain-containing protein [Bacteroidota bacterium]
MHRILTGFRSNLLSTLARYPNLKVLSENFEPKTDKGFKGYIINTSFASVKGSIQILMAINKDSKTIGTLSFQEKESRLHRLEQKITDKITSILFGKRKTELPTYQKLSQKGYESLLLAQYYTKKFTPADNDTAIVHFNNALKDNPNNSQALSGVAAVEFQQYRYGVHNYKKANQLRNWLEKALELDAENVQAHTIRALVAMYMDKDFFSAGISFQNALELERDYVDVLKEYAWFLLAISQDREAIKSIEKALEYDPISVDLLTTRADIYRYREDYKEALKWYEKAYNYNTSYSRSVEGMITCHTNLDDKNNAYRFLEIYSRRSANEFFVHRVGCEVATHFKDDSLFERSLKALEYYQKSHPQADLSSDLMTVYALTEPEKALPYLERAFKNGVGLVSIIRYPYLKKLWDTKSYKESLAQLQLDISLEELKGSQSRLLHIKSEGTETFTIARGLFAFSKAEGNYTEIHYIQKGKLTTQLLRLKLNALDNQLEDDFFKRIHNSYLVNMRQPELELQGNAHKATLVLKKFGVTLPVSRTVYKELK